MKKNFSALKRCALFSGMTDLEIENMASCLKGEERTFKKNDFILTAGDEISYMGIMLYGRANIVKEDFWGNRTILTQLRPGDIFGESFSFSKLSKVTVSVIAIDDAKVINIPHERITSPCQAACSCHIRLIDNMMRILANKNILLTQKMEHITRRTTREKLLSYLSAVALKNNSSEFEIPFNRQELADYLSIDRSAMTKELSKMRSEGILDFQKNTFILKNDSP